MTLTKARIRAQANADYFGRPYAIFLDSSGNLRIEQYCAAMACHNGPGAELVSPKQYDDSTVKILGA